MNKKLLLITIVFSLLVITSVLAWSFTSQDTILTKGVVEVVDLDTGVKTNMTHSQNKST